MRDRRYAIGDRRYATRTTQYATFLLLTLLAACAPQPLTVTPQPETVRIVATDTCGPLAEELAIAYQEAYPWITVQVDVFNDAVAEQRLRAGAADLALLSWASEDPAPLWTVSFARDAVAVIVHPAVPAESLNRPDLHEVFRGRIGEWADGTPIQVVSREEGSGVRAVFEAAVMDGRDVTLTALMVADSAAMVEAVAATPGAIGYVSLGRLDGSVRALAIDGLLPDRAVQEGGPLAYPLFLAAPAEPTGAVRDFAQWVLSPDGQAWVARRFSTTDR